MAVTATEIIADMKRIALENPFRQGATPDEFRICPECCGRTVEYDGVELDLILTYDLIGPLKFWSLSISMNKGKKLAPDYLVALFCKLVFDDSTGEILALPLNPLAPGLRLFISPSKSCLPK